MLELFEQVSKVGLFDDYSHSAGCEFREVTLVYGENGVGKSTLAAILDSLRENSPAEIIRRKSLPGTVEPTAVVRTNGKVYSFDGKSWDVSHPHETLEVFYPGFVTRNVHAATEVSSDHRRNLCEFVLGRKAVANVERLTQTDREARTALDDLKAIEKQLLSLIKQPDTLETFPSLSNDPCIDERIAAVDAELKQARSKDAILKRPVAKAIALPSVDREAICALLAMSIDGVGSNVGDIIQQHISKHLDKKGENWLAEGAKYADTSTTCPFCAQDLIGSDLASAIRSYFGTAYREYSDSLSQQIGVLRAQLGSAAYAPLRSAIAGQVAVAAQWADEFPIDPVAIEATLCEAETIWKSSAGKFGAVVANKQAKPLEPMDPALVDATLVDYERAISMLAAVNDTLVTSGRKADERKGSLSTADTKEIEIRLCRLENQKVRFEPTTQELLKQRNTFLDKRKELETEKKKLKKQIDQDASRVVGKYQDGINYYLAHFGSDIRIEAVEAGFPSGKASVKYTLKAHGHEIELGVSPDEPCFETVLSEGDKYTLALSFFLARLKEHSSLAGRIVVLDDPVNSLGSSRRTLVVNVIRDLRQRGAQIVVLTHDDQLAARVWRDKKLNRTITALQVEKTNSGSRLKPWDVEQATQSEYVAHYLAIVDFLENGGDHKPAAIVIRPYVEQRLRHLFPGPPFETRDSLGELISKIRNSPTGSRLDALKAKLSDLESINDATVPSHHATDDVPGLSPMSAADVRLFAQKAFGALG